jgi:N4-gp56 family major capsid protein
MSEGLDMVVRDALSSATNTQYAGAAARVGTSGTGAVGSGNYISVAEVREMRRTLRRAGARPPYTIFIHPDNTKDLQEDAEYADAVVNAGARGNDNPFFSGGLPPVAGVGIVETNNLRVRSSYGMSGADVYECIMFGKGFYGVSELDSMQARLIIHPRGTGGHTDPLDQYSTIGWKAALATAILNNNFGGIIYCASSRSNAA